MSGTLLYTDAHNREAVQQVVSAVVALGAASEAFVLAPNAPDAHSFGRSVHRVSAAALPGLHYERVVVHTQAAEQRVADVVVDDALSRPLTGIRRWSPEQGLVPYEPYSGCESGVLAVFPGVPAPVSMGSQRRVCELTRHLNDRGVHTDLLLRGAVGGAGREMLHVVAPGVHGYEFSPRMLAPLPLARNLAERGMRRLAGDKHSPPELFSERLRKQTSPSGIRALAGLLQKGQYHTVVLNYAWMAGLMRGLPAAVRRRARWVCDSHDVQFVRNATANEGQRRLAVDFRKERECEIELLREFDAVVAISESDARELRKVLDPERVLLAPTGFDYALAERPVWPHDPSALRFGFLGGPMQANVAALRLIVEQWWPHILEAFPNSRLTVGGAVSRRAEVRDLCFLEPGIELAGFVPSLASYYAGIDVALSPVVVQGGLNFKSVEPLMAGALLVTTPMGARCLGSDAPAVVVESGEQLVEQLHGRLSDAASGTPPVWNAQRWARERFGNEAAYRALVEYLRG